MNVSQKNHRGFSLLEVIASIVIMSVVAAATVATVAPMRARSEEKLAVQDIVSLNAMSQTYFLEFGHYPADVNALAASGYLALETPAQKKRVRELSQYPYNEMDGRFRLSGS